jgi:hypothetical protein
MSRKSTLSIPEALIVGGICFGLFILLSFQAMLAGFPDAPFSDAGMVWGLGCELVLAAAALTFLRARGFDIASLAPQPTLKGSAAGLGLFFGAWLLGAVVTSMFQDVQGSQPIERMVSESRLSMPVIIAFALVNATFEEVVTDRRNGARDVRRNGASFWLLNRAPEGVEERGYFAAFAGLDLTLPAAVLGARYEAPSRTMQ